MEWNFKIMEILLIFVVILGVIIFFLRIPYSPTSTQFKQIVSKKNKPLLSEMFTKNDIKDLPLPVQQYFRYCKYIGTPKMTYMQAHLENVDFIMSDNKTIKIDYKQINFVNKPDRFAYISSSLVGIPFEGLDFYKNGKGNMKGTLAKIIPLFNQQNRLIDQSCLVTWLAECLIVPNAALQDFVKWETIDKTHAKASVSWKNISVSGIFTFKKNGELLNFRTKDRIAIDIKGKVTKAEWSALFLKYHSVNGILQPKIIQSIWHYPNKDCPYFNQNKETITIYYQ